MTDALSFLINRETELFEICTSAAEKVFGEFYPDSRIDFELARRAYYEGVLQAMIDRNLVPIQTDAADLRATTDFPAGRSELLKI
ncbi:MAG: hypothetical protein HS115_06830 [Spirochaetales bacterium]|nr:hypothetical protein [Spirochaetales bacterium]